MKDYLAPFAAAFVLCCVAFLAMDFVLMDVQGLSLIYRP